MLDVYPVALVLNFHRAARLNRRILVADLAVGVSLGIRDAFAKEGKLVQSWFKDFEELHPPSVAPASSGTGSQPAVLNPEPASNPLSPWTQHLPVVKRKRHGG